MKNSKCSLTVSLSNRTLCWGHSPRLSRMASISVNILLPFMWAEPDVGGKRPVRIDMVVVFPAPLWPSKAVICPLYIWSDNPSTATLEPAEPWKGQTVPVSSCQIIAYQKRWPTQLCCCCAHGCLPWTPSWDLWCQHQPAGHEFHLQYLDCLTFLLGSFPK